MSVNSLEDSNIENQLAPPFDVEMKSFESYHQFVRPKVAELLGLLKLDHHFTDGKDNHLFYINKNDDNNKIEKILDLTGGYGSNILGHKNQEIINFISENIRTLPPSQTQGSIRKYSAELAKKLNSIIINEIKSFSDQNQKLIHNYYISNFSNSGAEAIEAAIKACLIHFQKKINDFEIKLNKTFNSFHLALSEMYQKENNPAVILTPIKKMITSIPEDFWINIDVQHLTQKILKQDHFDFQLISNLLSSWQNNIIKLISKQRTFAHFEKSYHGKTLGSIQLTSNNNFKTPFGIESEIKPVSLSRDDIEFNQVAFNKMVLNLFIPEFSYQGITSRNIEFSTLAGVFTEIIQGEAGIYKIDQKILFELRRFSLKYNIPFVSDEIQSGLYRTGKFACTHHLNIQADIYTFAKGLGSGVAKVAVTMIGSNIYQQDFSYLHTSTFAEDDFSSAVSLKTIELLESAHFISKAMKHADKLKNELNKLKDIFPFLIKSINGEGVMLGIEFSDQIVLASQEFRLFYDMNLLGHVLASAFFHNEKMRIAPTMSNQLCLRISPSLNINEEIIQEIISGLTKFLLKLEQKSTKYFLEHILSKPFQDHEVFQEVPKNQFFHQIENKKNIVCFLSHAIDYDAIKSVLPSMEKFSDDEIQLLCEEIFPLAEFKPYFSGELIDAQGNEIFFMLLSLPIPTPVLVTSLKKDPNLVKRKIQNAIDYAHQIGAKVVGLGQFTSIVTTNGLDLNPRSMSITTGNNFTVSTSVEAVLKACQLNQINIEDSTLGIIGPSGNISSVASMILGPKFNRIILFYHTHISQSAKLQQSLLNLIKTIMNSQEKSLIKNKFFEITEKYLDTDLIELIHRGEFKHLIDTSSDYHQIKECDVIYSGTSDTKSFIDENNIKKNAVVLDVSVPSNVKSDLTKIRPDILLISGGIIKLPEINNKTLNINPPSYPLKSGECFACMAETMLIGLNSNKNIRNIGPVTIEKINLINNWSKNSQFEISELKNLNTF